MKFLDSEELVQDSLEYGCDSTDEFNFEFPIEKKSEKICPYDMVVAFERKNCHVDYNLPHKFNFFPEIKLGVGHAPFTVWRLMASSEEKNFLNNHPCANLVVDSLIVFRGSDGHNYKTILKSFDVDLGLLIIETAIIMPFLSLDMFLGDPDKLKTERAMLNLNIRRGVKDTIIDQVLNKVPFDCHDSVVRSKFMYWNGCVGSGKTTKLVDQICTLKQDGIFNIVVAPTNPSLSVIHGYLSKRNKRVVQYTNQDVPFSFKNLFSKNSLYMLLNRLNFEKPSTDKDRQKNKRAIKRAKESLRLVLSEYVILVTPSKLIDLIGFFGFEDDVVRVFVDEAALMNMTSFVSIMLLRLDSLFLYGDHRQDRPYNEDFRLTGFQNVTNRYVDKVIDNFLNESVVNWMLDMKIPTEIDLNCVRLPDVDSRVIIPFFYSAAENTEVVAKWLPTVMVSGEKLKTYKPSFHMAKSMLCYPFMTFQQKEKESKWLDRFMQHVNFVLENYALPPGAPFLKVALISPYRHIVGSMEELGAKFLTKYSNVSSLVFITVKKCQGSTYDLVFVYTPSNPTSFFDDNSLLVAISRHRLKLCISPFVVSALVTSTVVFYLLLFDFIVLIHVSSGKGLSYKKHGYKIVVRNRFDLMRFFVTKTFEKYRSFGEYMSLPYDSPLRFNWRRESPFLLEGFNSRKCCFEDGEGSFKYIVWALLYTKFIFRPGFMQVLRSPLVYFNQFGGLMSKPSIVKVRNDLLLGSSDGDLGTVSVPFNVF